MSLTSNDKSCGPFTWGPWRKTFEASLIGDDGDGDKTNIRFVGFGFALRIAMPFNIPPAGKYRDEAREYGISITDLDGEGYDWLTIRYGPATHDSSTDHRKSWSFPWKQWRCVRYSLYRPDGTLYADKPTALRGVSMEQRARNYDEWCVKREACPVAVFKFRDYDGKEITARCRTEEYEHHRGDGWFKWLSYFCAPQIRRSLWMEFDDEVGTGKGSWKGGTIATGQTMEPGDTPETAFRRYCEREHRSRDGNYRVTYLGEVQGARS